MAKEKNVTLPSSFFSAILPEINTLSELKVTLFIFWLLEGKGNRLAHFTLEELQLPEIIMALTTPEQEGIVALREGLQRAVIRGTFLRAQVQPPEQPATVWYWLNTPESRSLLQQIERGIWPASIEKDGQNVRLHWQQPNIFILYEQNIGPLTPLLADELRDTEQEFPEEWIQEAFRIAMRKNVRNWKYVHAILERWRQEGKDETDTHRQTSKEAKKYLGGKYADFIKH